MIAPKLLLAKKSRFTFANANFTGFYRAAPTPRWLSAGIALCVGIGTGLELDSERRALQLERLAKEMFQVALVCGRQRIEGAAMHDYQRRIAAALMRIAQFGAPVTAARRLLALDRGLQCARKMRRRQLRHGRPIGGTHGRTQLVDAAPLFR